MALRRYVNGVCRRSIKYYEAWLAAKVEPVPLRAALSHDEVKG